MRKEKEAQRKALKKERKTLRTKLKVGRILLFFGCLCKTATFFMHVFQFWEINYKSLLLQTVWCVSTCLTVFLLSMSFVKCYLFTIATYILHIFIIGTFAYFNSIVVLNVVVKPFRKILLVSYNFSLN